MVTITIEIPNDLITDMVDAFAIQYNYPESIPDPENPSKMILNPVNKLQFAKNAVKSFIKEIYTGAQLSNLETTRQQLIADAITTLDDVDVV